MIDKNQIEQRLKNHGYKLTHQRKAIIDVLVEHKGHFLSAEEIYLKSKEKCSQTNFSTIYRNLEILVNTNIIHKTQVKEGTFSYELVCSDEHHHHLICKGCGKTEAIDFCPIEDLKKTFQPKNFTLTDHKFELYGYCHQCQRDQE